MKRTIALLCPLLALLSVRSLSAQIATDPFNTHIQAAQMAANAGLPVIAAREYRAALALHPVDADALYALGGILEEMHQPREAMNEYQAVIRLRPDDAPAHNALAGLLEDDGQTAAALAQYRQALAISPGDARLHFNLAAALDEAGNSGEAQREYREALRLKPDFLEAQAALRADTPALAPHSPTPVSVPAPIGEIASGERLLHQGRLSEAQTAFRAFLTVHPRDAAAHLNLGIALYADGQAASARREWTLARGLGNPDVAAQAMRLLAACPAGGDGTNEEKPSSRETRRTQKDKKAVRP